MSLASRFANYEKINGLIYVCAADSVISDSKTIEGYFYHEERWVSGTFPYPGSLYKRVRVSESILLELKNHLGDKIFNSNYFNKWQLWEHVSTHSTAKQYVPRTIEYHSLEDLEKMIDTFDVIYMKPKTGMKGHGIVSVQKTSAGVKFTNRKKEISIFKSVKEAEDYINKVIKNKGYILQQGVPTLFESRNVDFRMYLQKNEKKEWICQGLIGRFSKPNSIITNMKMVDFV
ncbi:unnamed protein product, partial [Chrysoparadoxa australica]